MASTKAALPDWSGRTVVCIGSGPSLTQEDCEKLRGLPTVVANTSYQLAPWADVLFAWDWKWWREHAKGVADFEGLKFSSSVTAERFGAKCVMEEPWFVRFQNSGACTVAIAIAAKASKVLMLGFDCQSAGGKTHWHGAHPPALSDAISISRWPKTFRRVAAHAQNKGVEVVNVSRETALTCFRRAPLEDFL